MQKFEAGKTYKARIITNSDQIIFAKITARTEKTVTAVCDGNGSEPKKFRVAIIDGVEAFKPWGAYSMAPIIRASSEAK